MRDQLTKKGQRMMKTTISHKRSRRTTEGAPGASRPGFFKRATATVLMLLLAGAAALALSTPAKAAEDPANYSFYKLSSSLAAFFSNAQSPDEKAEKLKPGVWTSVLNDPGSAGSMLGYVDPDFSFSMEFLNSQISGSSSAVGYNTLIQSTQDGGGSTTQTPGMLDYAHFGATLNAMGLDSMSTGLSLNIFLPIGGGLMMLLYIFTGVVDLIFIGMINTLKALNPFTLFYAGVHAVSPTFADGMTGGQAPPGFLGGLSSWIGQWYGVLNDLSWAVLVPLFIGVLLLGLLLSKNMNRGSAIRKLIIRLVFIGVGLPLVGSMYTGVLNSMGDATKGGSSGSTQVVLSTYVDFQNWALKNRLYVPNKAVIEWDATGHKPTGRALANVRNTALEINKSTNPSWSGITSTLNVAADQSWTDAAIKDTTGDAAGGLGGYMSTIDLLARYMSGAKVEAASFETAAKGDISTSAPYSNDEEGKKQVSEWFTKFSDPKKGLPEIDDDGTVSGNPVISVANGTGLLATPAGQTSGNKRFTSPSQWGCQAFVSNGRGEPLNCNMSSLSLYNYLNTSFGTDSMTMYSSNKAASGATREMHSAVTQVGTGTMSGLYWLNSMVLLGSFVLIGVGYAFSMLFSNIKRSFQLITAIPFATIGALPAIAKVVIYSAAMILEVIVTLFIYRFVQVFLISIPQIVEVPFSAVLNAGSPLGDVPTSVHLVSGGTLPMVMTVLSIIALIIFTVLALRTRKTLVKAINEAVTKLVDKFMDTNVAPPGGGGMMPALAGGMASGAGMAAANKIMSGSPAGGAKKLGGPGAGPGGIAAGGIPAAGGPGGPNDGGPAGVLPPGGGPPPPPPGGGGGGAISNSHGGSPGGNGNPGSPLALGPGPSVPGTGGIAGAASSDQSTARAVAAQGGLSDGPGAQGSGDITDSMAASLDKSRAQYGAKDAATAGGAVAGGKAVLKGAEAAGRGMAGDAAGAASAGMAAAGHAKEVQGSVERAKAIGKDIDAPAPVGTQTGQRTTPPAPAAPKTAPTQAGPRVTPAPRPAQKPQQMPAQANGKRVPAPRTGNAAATAVRTSQAPAVPPTAPKPTASRTTPAPRPAQRPQQTRPQVNVRQAPAPRTAPAQAPRPKPAPAPRMAPAAQVASVASPQAPANRPEPRAPRVAPLPVRKKDGDA
jgi:hypothetical protein